LVWLSSARGKDQITVVVDDSIMRLLEEKENHSFFFL